MNSDPNISLIEFARLYPNLSINVNCGDLISAFRSVVNEELIKKEQASINEETEILLTEAEVVKMLNVCHSTLWRWNKENYLVPVKIGRKSRYKKSDIIKIKCQIKK